MRDRLNGLSDAARTGKPRQYDRETDRRVLALLDQDPPRGYARWNGRLLAEALGDVSADHTWRILRKYKMRAQGSLRLPDGKAVNGFSHCYKRHGTTTLFAALNILTGQAQTGHYPPPP